MGILNLTPDSFWEPSRYDMSVFQNPGVDIVDIGAVSTRPGAESVSEREEWERLCPILSNLHTDKKLSIDTTRSSIVRKAFEMVGPFMVNDISAGEDDPQMLSTVAELGLRYVAMHKRGNPRTMDTMCDYPCGVMAELLRYFGIFALKARQTGVSDWILDPGLGFAKTDAQNMEILRNLDMLRIFGRPILLGPSDKRFTKGREREVAQLCAGADILRLHVSQESKQFPAGSDID